MLDEGEAEEAHIAHVTANGHDGKLGALRQKANYLRVTPHFIRVDVNKAAGDAPPVPLR